jgi:uncharacterized protein (TIGR02391 family)
MAVNRSLLTALQQYQRTHDKAVQLFGLFEEADASELLRVQQELGEHATQLLEIAGLNWDQCGSLGRHLTFLSYYLKRNDKDSCAADIKDILFYDLPAVLRSLILGTTEDQYLDEKLRDAVHPLLEGGHYDSAIRKTFVVLTDRLRRAFGIIDEVDGEDLVNLVFGKGGKIPVALNDSKKQALRNLVSGFYGVYRNRYAHNNREADFADARAIIEMANQLLSEIEEVADASAKQA